MYVCLYVWAFRWVCEHTTPYDKMRDVHNVFQGVLDEANISLENCQFIERNDIVGPVFKHLHDVSTAFYGSERSKEAKMWPRLVHRAFTRKEPTLIKY